MRKTFFLFAVLAFASCKKEEPKKEPLYPTNKEVVSQTPVQLGKEIFEGKGNCVACHQVAEKVIGPSLQDIAKIYKDKNAYFIEGPFRKTARPSHRNYLGHIDAYLRDSNLRELALGTNSRSGDQWDVWESVYSPVGADGYPKPIWNKYTGEIDSTVARYWRDNYDLGYILERDWNKLGNKLKGKIKIHCGDKSEFRATRAIE